MSALDAQRAIEKQAAREADQRAIAEGRKSPEQVNRENSLAYGLSHRFKLLAPSSRASSRDSSR
jgi:hypothetical protein